MSSFGYWERSVVSCLCNKILWLLSNPPPFFEHFLMLRHYVMIQALSPALVLESAFLQGALLPFVGQNSQNTRSGCQAAPCSRGVVNSRLTQLTVQLTHIIKYFHMQPAVSLLSETWVCTNVSKSTHRHMDHSGPLPLFTEIPLLRWETRPPSSASCLLKCVFPLYTDNSIRIVNPHSCWKPRYQLDCSAFVPSAVVFSLRDSTHFHS